jgi:hypothetical protein
MMLESFDGKNYLPSTNYVLESATERGATLSYHFRERDGSPLGKPSDWRVRYRTPANLIQMPIKFTFKNIPLS